MLDQPSPEQDPLPEIGTLWISGSLSRLERACLRSMLSLGHRVTIYTFGQVASLPPGVRQADAREIIGDRKPFRWTGPRPRFWKKKKPDLKPDIKEGSFALFSDLFRYHLLAATDLVWADLDVFLLRPLRCRQTAGGGGEYYIAPLGSIVDNGILRLPRHSEALRNLIEFCRDEYPVPSSFPAAKKIRLRLERFLGNPRCHVSQFPWMYWGPPLIARFLNETGEMRHAYEQGRTWHKPSEIQDLYLPRREFEALLNPECDAVHVCGALLRPRLRDEGIPPGSYIEWILQHGD